MNAETPNDEINFDIDAAINPMELDVEWFKHANLVAKYSRLCSDSEAKAKRAEERMKTMRSKIIKLVYAKPSKLPGGKPVAQVVEAYYRSHPKYISLKEKMLTAQHTHSLCLNAMSVLSNKRTAMENLVKLLAMDFWSGPKSANDFTDKEMRKRIRTEASDKVKTRKNKCKACGGTGTASNNKQCGPCKGTGVRQSSG